MALSSDLASQFAKVAAGGRDGKKEFTVYGKALVQNGKTSVLFDGAEESTPVESTVSVRDEERVIVSVNHHQATITGNLSDPSASVSETEEIKLEVKNVDNTLRSSITITAEQIRSEVTDVENGLNSKITQTASEIRSEVTNKVTGLSSRITQTESSIETLVQDGEDFSKFQQTVEGFAFMNKGGTVKISGGSINLTGSITFSDFSSSTMSEIDNIRNDAGAAKSTANDAKGIADEAKRIAQANGVPSYIKETYIDSTEIQSPSIKGNDISVYGTFQTKGYDPNMNIVSTGYMGSAKGMAGDGSITYGVALASSWDPYSYEVSNYYLIVTNAGVRMQAGSNSVVVTTNGIWLDAQVGDIYLRSPNGNVYCNGKAIE